MTVSAVCWGRQQSRDTIFTGGWDRKVLAWDHMDLKSGPIGVLEVRPSSRPLRYPCSSLTLPTDLCSLYRATAPA